MKNGVKILTGLATLWGVCSSLQLPLSKITFFIIFILVAPLLWESTSTLYFVSFFKNNYGREKSLWIKRWWRVKTWKIELIYSTSNHFWNIVARFLNPFIVKLRILIWIKLVQYFVRETIIKCVSIDSTSNEQWKC